MRKVPTWSVMLIALSLSACGGDEGANPEADAAPGEAELRAGWRCGTIAGIACPRGQYCDTGPGSCDVADAAGVCRFMPWWCSAQVDPVCGCDGTTYSSGCLAARAGVVVDHAGACVPPEVRCGGIAGELCPAGQYCDLGVGSCQVADAAGLCKEVPQGCAAEYVPVCGCDGKTYSSACDAARAGVNVDHAGACVPPAGSCTSDMGCADGQYCRFAEGQCRVSGAVGQCAKRAEVCLQYMDPVCGCDGRTYYNSCAAAAAGVSVAYHAECGY